MKSLKFNFLVLATLFLVACEDVHLSSGTNGSDVETEDSGNLFYIGTEGGAITMAEGTLMTADFQSLHTGNEAFFIDKESIEGLLQQDVCVGLKFVQGWKNENRHLMAVGASASGEEILTNYLLFDLEASCPGGSEGEALLASSTATDCEPVSDLAALSPTVISTEEALNLNAGFKNLYPAQTYAMFMGEEILSAMMTQEGVTGIRVYLALNEDGTETVVLAGVDAANTDLTGSDNVLANRGTVCPPDCPDASLF